MTPDAALDRVPRRPPAYRLVALEEIDSTSKEAKRLAAAGAEDGTLVWARRQTAGYGRQGREWTSEEGNLFASLVTRPECSQAEAAQLSFIAEIAMGEAIGNGGPPVLEGTNKGPNDVMLQGRKRAGTRQESERERAESPAWQGG